MERKTQTALNQNSTHTIPPEDDLDLMKVMREYLAYWHWILLGVVLCVLCGVLYIMKKAPEYETTASVLVQDKNGTQGGSALSMLAGSSGAASLLSGIGGLSFASAFDDEVEKLNSRSLVQRVIEDLDMYVTVTTKEGLRTVDLYGRSPLRIWTTPAEAVRMKKSLLEIDLKKDGSMDITATVGDEKILDEEPQIIQKHIASLPVFLRTKYGVISISRVDSVPMVDLRLKAHIADPANVAKECLKEYTVEPKSKQAHVADFSYTDVNKQRGSLFLNTLINRYNSENKLDINRVADKTADFINHRIQLVAEELGVTEKDMAVFKKRAGLTDVQADAEITLTARAEYQKLVVENQTRLSLISDLKRYIHSVGNRNVVLPISIGLSDDNESLATLIGTYNEQVIERERLGKNSSENNTVIRNMDAALAGMRHNIMTTVNTLDRNARITQSKLDAQADQYNGFVSNAPEAERNYIRITRQLEFQSKLYLALMQKREENLIALSTMDDSTRLVNNVLTDDKPVSPKKPIVLAISFLLGLLLPIGIIYVRKVSSSKYEDTDTLEKDSDMDKGQIIEIPFQKGLGKEPGVFIAEHRNTTVEELFRKIRLRLLQDDEDAKVILCASTTKGEGTTTVASNLAASYAFGGKKTVVVDLNYERPGIHDVFRLSPSSKGVYQYLKDPENGITAYLQPSGISSDLWILSGTSIPDDAAELMSYENILSVLDALREDFDIIILDTPSAANCYNTQVIASKVDVVAYIARAGVTSKEGFASVKNSECMSNVWDDCLLLVNAVKL